MSVLPQRPGTVAAALAPPTATAGAQWIYADVGRTHLVHATLETRAGKLHFVVAETPIGSRAPEDVLVQATPLAGPWDVAVERAALEMRLAGSGDYERADGNRWTRITARPSISHLDGHLVPVPGGNGANAEFHLFHDRKQERERALVSLPRVDLPDGRFVLAELAFRFPHVETGDLGILHARLAQATLRSRLVRAHLDLRSHGFAKVVTNEDFLAAYGPDWRTDVRNAFDALTRRLLAGRLGRGDGWRPETVREPPVHLAALRMAYTDATLARVRAANLAPSEESALVARGEFAIRRWTTTRRKSVAHNEQHLLSLLECYLLARHGDEWGDDALRDREGAKLLRLVGKAEPRPEPVARAVAPTIERTVVPVGRDGYGATGVSVVRC